MSSPRGIAATGLIKSCIRRPYCAAVEQVPALGGLEVGPKGPSPSPSDIFHMRFCRSFRLML